MGNNGLSLKRKITNFMVFVIILVTPVACSLYNLRTTSTMKMIDIPVNIYDHVDGPMLRCIMVARCYQRTPLARFTLLNDLEVALLAEYMEKQHVKIVPGQYKIPQSARSTQMIQQLKFSLGRDSDSLPAIM